MPLRRTRVHPEHVKSRAKHRYQKTRLSDQSGDRGIATDRAARGANRLSDKEKRRR